MRRFIFGTRRRKILAAVFSTFLIAGVAFAAWTVITSSGSSNAKIGSLTAPTISDGSVVAAGDIFPSATLTATGGLRMAVNNPNSSQLYLKSLAVDATNVIGGDVGCDFGIRARTGGPVANLFGWAGQGTWYNDPGAGTQLAIGAATKTFSGLSIAVPASVTTQVVVPLAIFASDSIPTQCQGQVISGLAVTNATFSTAP